MQNYSGSAEQHTNHSQYGRAQQPVDHSHYGESTLVVSPHSRTSSSAEQPTNNPTDIEDNQTAGENNSCKAAKQALDTPLLIYSFEFHGWYTSAYCAMVNKTWKQAADEWRQQLNEISLFNCKPINDEVLNMVAKSCPRLHTLDLSTNLSSAAIPAVGCTARALTAVARGCPELQHLIVGPKLHHFQFTSDDDVLPFVTYCQQLSAVDVSYCCIGDNAGIPEPETHIYHKSWDHHGS